MPTFIDNVAIQVTERTIVDGLEEIFSSKHIGRWSDDQIAKITAECEETVNRREYLEKLKVGLEGAKSEIADLMNVQDRPRPKQRVPQTRPFSEIS